MPLGFLQTPQTFYNWDLFQYHLYAEQDVANEQDYFYREIEVAKTNSNSVIYGGSNTIISREALDSAGGFYTKAITEDFATGMLIERNGYVSLAISDPLAAGLAPEDLPGLIQQRIRWGRGVVNVLYQINLFFTKRFSTAQKINYWTSIQYWLAPFARLLYIFIPIISGLFGISVVRTPLWAALIFWIPMAAADALAIRKLSGNIRTSIWTNLYETIMFPFLIGPIFMEFIGISLKKFKVTDKGVKNSSHFKWSYIWPFLMMLALTVLAIIVIIHDMLHHRIFGASITLFWLCYNGIILVAAVLFFIGRPQSGLVSLHHSAVFGILNADAHRYEGAVAGLSEHELDLIFDQKLELKLNQTGKLTLEYEESEIEIPVKMNALFEKRGLTIGRFNIEEEARQKFRDDYDRFLNLVFNRPVPSVSSTPTRMFIPLISRHIQNQRAAKKDRKSHSED